MEDIRKRYPMVDLSIFTFNKNILSKVTTNFVAKFCPLKIELILLKSDLIA